MNAIEVFRSNQAEVLLNALHERLSAPVENPFAPELVVVQGRGMAVWLSMQLARRQGVWANAEFVYPKNFVRRAFAAVLPEVEPAQDPFAQKALLWGVLAVLPAHLHEPAFAPLAQYLATDTDGTRLFQLAQKISETFDEYLTYRPELLRRWEQAKPARADHQLDLFSDQAVSEHEAWQKALWRELVAKNGSVHNAALERKFQQALSRRRSPQGLPERISVFGLSSLPPQYVRVLAALATQTQVQVFLLSPSKEYYAEAIRQQAAAESSALQNPLLLSYGALGAELQEVISAQLEAQGVPEHAHDSYVDPARSPNALGATSLPSESAAPSVLSRLQEDILKHQNGPANHVLELPDNDDSLTFHSCHSPIREVEVLHDQLLALLTGPERIKPEEIVVMTPNVDDYAALVEAVFERSRDDARFIPYRISDRSLQSDSAVLDAFVRILTLADSRASASEILDILTLAPVRERFGILSSDLPVISEWVVQSGIRWGFDAEHRAEHGLPRSNQNTWAFGLQRLLLGYAVSGDDSLCLGVLPFPEIEGRPALLLGQLIHFTETLFGHLRQLAQPRSPEHWQSTLTALLADLLFQDKNNAWQHQQALSALSEMVSAADGAGFKRPLPLSVIRQLLTSQFDQNRDARGFLAGGVTFCAMVPMRSIPFKVVCLLGMNDASFPRRSRRADFNLIDHGPEPRQLGDPNRRVDDRYLFLEALLSARHRLLITFVGQSVRDNAPIPPSIVVTELLDYVVAQYAGDDHERQAQTREQLVTIHPLQPFSPRYFNGEHGKLFSFEQAFLKGAKLLGPERRPALPLFSAPLPPLELRGELELSELLSFFAGPASHLLRHRLKVQLEQDELQIVDREPLQLAGLENYQVGAPVLTHQLQGLSKERSLELACATGALPSGAPGIYEFERVLRNAQPIAESAALIRTGEALAPSSVRLRISEDLLLHGELAPLWPAGLVSVQYSRISGKHLLLNWIRHLVLCAQGPDGMAAHTWLIGRPEEGDGRRICRFTPVEAPLAVLSYLTKLYQLGQCQPLLLFPESSITFASKLRMPRSNVGSALYSAGRVWKKETGYSRALQRLYGQDSDLTEEGPNTLIEPAVPSFSQLALDVAGPLLDHLEEVV